MRDRKGEEQDIYETTLEERKKKNFRTDGSNNFSVIGQDYNSRPGIGYLASEGNGAVLLSGWRKGMEDGGSV